MKKQSSKVFTFLLGLATLFMVSCGGDMQNNGTDEGTANNGAAGSGEVAEAMDMSKVLEYYFDVKNALVSSDGATAMISANKLASNASGEVQAAAMEVKGSTDIAVQRAAFDKLSQKLYDALKKDGGNSATVYKQFCPMAFENKGAFWLSQSSDIKNPYFGDEMLTCGSVQEELAVK